MDRYTLPSGWEDFSDTALAARLEEIETYTRRLLDEDADFNIDSPAGDDTPSGVDVAESLAAAKTEIEALQSKRAEQAAVEADRRAAALAALATPEPEVVETPEPEVAPVELAAEETVVETAPVEAAPVVDTEPAPEPVVETPVVEPVELAAEEAPAVEAEPAPVEEPAPAPAKDPVAVLSNMNSMRSASEQPRPAVSGHRSGSMVTTGPNFHDVDGFAKGDLLGDIDALSVYMAERLSKRNTNPYGGSEPEYIPLVSAFANYDDNERLSASDLEHNYRVTDAVTSAYADQNEALVAAGGPCAPIPPSYDFTSCFQTQRPVEAGIPSVGAPRGGIRFLDQQPLNVMAGGVEYGDAAQGALLPGAAGYADKTCVRVPCPTETTVSVGRIHKCVTFDNLNFRVFPEQVRHMLELLDLEFTRRKEVQLLDRLDALSNPVVDINAAQASPMGSIRSLLRDLIVAGHNYRKRNNMNDDAMLDVWLPTAAKQNLIIDAAMDYNNGSIDGLVRGSNAAALIAQVARLNVMYYYYDATTTGFPASAHNQAGGTWNTLPATFRSYMTAPGSVVRLDGGSLDLGVVRDSTLNAQNDLQLFAEEWFELARPGCEIDRFDHAACYSGVGPLGVAAPACP